MNEPGTLRSRLQSLIDVYFSGSANQAATAWGIPQSTLQRIVAGRTTSPRADVLSRIAQAHGCSIEWLLSGRGEPPSSSARPPMHSQRTGDWWALARTVERLEVDASLQKALGDLPNAPRRFLDLLAFSARTTGDTTDERPIELRPVDSRVQFAAIEAERRIARGWRGLFEAIIDVYGADALRDRLEETRDYARVGYSPFAIELLESAKLRGTLDEAHEAYAPTEGFLAEHDARQYHSSFRSALPSLGTLAANPSASPADRPRSGRPPKSAIGGSTIQKAAGRGTPTKGRRRSGR